MIRWEERISGPIVRLIQTFKIWRRRSSIAGIYGREEALLCVKNKRQWYNKGYSVINNVQPLMICILCHFGIDPRTSLDIFDSGYEVEINQLFRRIIYLYCALDSARSIMSHLGYFFHFLHDSRSISPAKHISCWGLIEQKKRVWRGFSIHVPIGQAVETTVYELLVPLPTHTAQFISRVLNPTTVSQSTIPWSPSSPPYFCVRRLLEALHQQQQLGERKGAVALDNQRHHAQLAVLAEREAFRK